MFGTAVRLSHVADLPVVEYNTWEVARSTFLLKRALDLAVGVPLLLLALPVIAVVALAVRLDTPGPSLFRQRRAGIGEHPFRMFKFRSMEFDAERRLEEIGVDFEALSDPMFKVPDDPRITRLGKLLRRSSLDELPQLLNVVKGDMSMVGPRPEELGIARLYAPEERFRLSVKPGLTGPMQVYGRGDLQWDERLAVEREYVENLSLGRDLRILAMTAAAVLGRRGAY
jgi:lipopolysaccharide/colanic/teichoic acid biosynthesis glycosyltransferase